MHLFLISRERSLEMPSLGKPNRNIVAIIEARMNSSRLPGKVLMKSTNKSMLEIMCTRLKRSKLIDQIVVATTTNLSDDDLIRECERIGVDSYRGDEENVLSRVVDAMKVFNATIVVSLTADCPLIDAAIVDKCIDSFVSGGYDYFSNCHIRSFPDGQDVQVIEPGLLSDSLLRARNPRELEHVTLNIRNNISEYRHGVLIAKDDEYWPELGITLDEVSDYDLINCIVKNFHPDLSFDLSSILKFLRENPNISNINEQVSRRGNN
jgi:spore coat polysaccharide biosynthesis protein SpsF